MARALRTIAVIAGAVALVATGVGAFAVAGSALAATASSVATFASLAAGIASAGAMALAKKPPARGSVNTISIATNAATPCILGETYTGGVLRHDVGYGGKVGKVQNPYRGMVVVYGGAGPNEELVGQYADFIEVPFSGGAATGYYSSFMYADAQLGETPESSALTPNWSGMTGWSASHKLSGKAAILWNLKFDKDGKYFTSGVPQLGAVWKGVKCYDAREDDTYPGGAGDQRIDDITTWAYSEWPDDHAVSYIYGRHFDGKKVFGIGLPVECIDLPAFVAWGNVCRANDWKIGGVIYEPDDRWANLKRIMAAGSAEPIFAGGVLSVKFDAPRVSLVTITADDLSDGPITVRAMQGWRERINTIVPKYRSGAHKWEYVESEAVSAETYLEEDGEEKIDTYQIDLCQDKDQAAQLAAYRLVNGREIFPIEIPLKPDFRFYRPGDMVTIDIPEVGLADQDCVIVRRAIDPQTFAVRFTLMSETAAKHDYALDQTGTAPPTPTLLAPADRDEVAAVNASPPGYDLTLISSSYISGATGGGNPMSASDAGATASIVIEGHNRVYPDRTKAVSANTLTGLAFSTTYYVYYDDPDRAGGSVTYVATTSPGTAALSEAQPARHLVGYITTPANGAPDTGGGGGSPPGWGGGGGNPLP